MKRVIIAAMGILLLYGCDSKIAKEYKATYKTINIKKTNELIKEGNTKVIDVRTEDEYKKNHYKNAINIPYENIDNIINIVSKDEIVIVYSSDKNSSKRACERIIDMGYSLVYDLGKYK